MRKLTLTAVTATVALGAVGVAQAVTPATSMTASVSPSKKGTSKKPSNGKLSIDLVTTPSATDAPFATRTTVVHFDKNIRFGGKYLPTCASAQVQKDDTKCKKGSRVGSGSATGLALGLIERLGVKAYNGPGGNKIELLVTGSSPLTIRSVIEGKLLKDSGKFGQKLVVAVPESLQQPVAGAFATLTDFKTTVNGMGTKKRPYIGLAGCAGRTLNYQTDFAFTDGASSTATTTSSCS